MANILDDEKREQILALGRLGWSLRRIEEATGVRRETASRYLRAAGVAVRHPGRWGHGPPKPAKETSTEVPGRPPKPQEIRDLVVKLAQENTSWGYTRIRDVMRHLGHEIGRTTVQRILDADGIQPAPERRKRMPWATFLKAHWGAIAAMDFFKVEVLSLRGPIRYAVLVVMDLASRRVQIAGIIREPYESWMFQVLRNLIDDVDGFLLSHVYLIMDRDPVFTQELRARLEHAGIEPVRLPRRSPNLNAYVERFNRSIQEECLDRVVPLGEAHLRRLVREYVSHYHEERPHQGLNGRLVAASSMPAGDGRIVRRERLGGVLNYYYREAAGADRRSSFRTLRVRRCERLRLATGRE